LGVVTASFDSDDFERRLAASAVEGGPAETAGAMGHVLSAGGKRLRPLLVHHFGAMLDADTAATRELELAVELLHTATLVHDDLIDQASTRRGVPALHHVEGEPVALLVGDLYLARCGVHLANTGNPAAGRELFTALEAIVRGEIQQRAHRFDLGQSESDYLRTIQLKTASLLEAACAASVRVAGGSSGLVESARGFGRHLGLAFQLMDDVLDYTATEAEIGKPVGNDIREGTITLPLLVALADDPGLGDTLEEARRHEDFRGVVAAVRDSRGPQACRDLADQHSRLATDALGVFPAGEDREALAEMVNSLRSRRS
jgi:all-trans-nonaprenyl-diphosphate synthase